MDNMNTKHEIGKLGFSIIIAFYLDFQVRQEQNKLL